MSHSSLRYAALPLLLLVHGASCTGGTTDDTPSDGTTAPGGEQQNPPGGGAAAPGADAGAPDCDACPVPNQCLDGQCKNRCGGPVAPDHGSRAQAWKVDTSASFVLPAESVTGFYHAHIHPRWRLEARLEGLGAEGYRLTLYDGEGHPIGSPMPGTGMLPAQFFLAPDHSDVYVAVEAPADKTTDGCLTLHVLIGPAEASAACGQCPQGELCCQTSSLNAVPEEQRTYACAAPSATGTCPAPDIFVRADAITESAEVVEEEFEPDSCAMVEKCILQPGKRKLLRFDTAIPNAGDIDIYLGNPRNLSSLFEYSPCHGHYHFSTFARYRLLTLDGQVAAVGHKQAFCLRDNKRLAGIGGLGNYECHDQGITAGWEDIYEKDIDCQWVDVTGVAPGEYLLEVEVNFEKVLLEKNYHNNITRVLVTIP